MLPAENFDNSIKEFWPKNGPSIQEVEKYVKKYSKEKIVINILQFFLKNLQIKIIKN